MRPFVTALIDTYNHERFIEDAILSVLDQDFPASDMEILVVDDGSTDRTPEIIRKFAPRVRLLQKKNGGQASAINFGIANSKGAIVAFLDGDDLWFPKKLSRVMEEFDKDPSLVLAYHRYLFWDVKDNRVWDAPFNEVSGDILADPRKLLLYGAAPTSSLAFRRDALERVIPIPENCSFMHDSYLTATILLLGPVVALRDCLTKNRIHGQNLWFTQGGSAEAEVLRRRIKVRQAAIKSVREWVQLNGSPTSRSSVRTILRGWCLAQDRDRFQIRPPGRFRDAVHLCRHNVAFGSVATPAHLAFMWAQAFTVLILGRERLHYLEGIRTRIKRLAARLESVIRPVDRGSEAR